jgi:hypothetical protein
MMPKKCDCGAETKKCNGILKRGSGSEGSKRALCPDCLSVYPLEDIGKKCTADICQAGGGVAGDICPCIKPMG